MLTETKKNHENLKNEKFLNLTKSSPKPKIYKISVSNILGKTVLINFLEALQSEGKHFKSVLDLAEISYESLAAKLHIG